MMNKIKFTWDRNKVQSNIQKHKISFEEATSVFEDVHARMIPDPDHSETEDRFILLGYSRKARVLTVVHCYQGKDETIRIISARKSTRKEEAQYREFLS